MPQQSSRKGLPIRVHNVHNYWVWLFSLASATSRQYYWPVSRAAAHALPVKNHANHLKYGNKLDSHSGSAVWVNTKVNVENFLFRTKAFLFVRQT